jgi:hypothetical protein
MRPDYRKKGIFPYVISKADQKRLTFSRLIGKKKHVSERNDDSLLSQNSFKSKLIFREENRTGISTPGRLKSPEVPGDSPVAISAVSH